MIISLTVRNFRSIRDEQTLNLIASKKSDIHKDNIAAPLEGKLNILRTVALFGANASGKSNIVMALHALSYMVSNSSNWKLDEEIDCYEPFRLDEQTKCAPCYFELDFLGPNNLRYIYCVEFTKYGLEQEVLSFYPTSQRALLFKRLKNKDGVLKFSPGGHLKGKVKTIPCLKNNLYISKAANTEGAPDIVKELYRYFKNRLKVIHPGGEVNSSKLLQKESYRKKLAALLACADTGIVDVNMKERENMNDIHKFPDDMPEKVRQKIIEDFKYHPIFIHQGSNEEFKSDEESRGTIRLYELAPLFLIGLIKGDIIVVDELDNSLHPHISELLIKLFNDPLLNKKNAQLIFTSHDLVLMDSGKMRRDQICFTQKDKFGATELFAMDEIEDVRKDSPLAKWYMEGRFEAIPNINIKLLRDSLLDGLDE